LCNVLEVLKITKYKKTIGYDNMCLSVHNNKIKFKMLNQVLALKYQDPKHV